MTIAVACTLADGVVLGTDSAITIRGENPQTGETRTKTYHDAEKLFGLHNETDEPRLPVGIVTYGLAHLGNRTLRSYIRQFEIEHEPDELAGESLEDLCEELHDFFHTRYRTVIGEALEQGGRDFDEVGVGDLPPLGMFVGGYSPDEPVPETHEIRVQVPPDHDELDPVIQKREPGNFGSDWGGQYDGVQRFHKGYQPQVIESAITALLDTIGVDADDLDQEAVSRAIQGAVSPHEYQVPFVAMPVQEGVDYVKFLLQMMISQNRFVFESPTCAGPIRLAVVRKYEGFEWVTDTEFELRRT